MATFLEIDQVPDPSSQPALDALIQAVRELHKRAGRPSARALARQIGHRRISHSTVTNALKVFTTWQKLQLVVQSLHGDEKLVKGLWNAADQERRRKAIPRKADARAPGNQQSRLMPPKPEKTSKPELFICTKEFVDRLQRYFDDYATKSTNVTHPALEKKKGSPQKQQRPPALVRKSKSPTRRSPTEDAITGILTNNITLAKAWGWIR